MRFLSKIKEEDQDEFSYNYNELTSMSKIR